MKVAHVITDLFVGGAEMMLYKLVKSMQGSNCESVVISLLADGMLGKAIADLGVEVVELDMPRRGVSLKSMSRAVATVRRISPDVLQGWMYHGNLAASAWSAVSRSRPCLCWNVRQSIQDLRHEKRLTRDLIRLSCGLSSRTDAIVFNSSVSAAQHEALGYAASRTVVIPNGFETDRFERSERAGRAFRRRFSIGIDVPLVGTAARRHPCKGHDILLRAAARVKRAVPETVFVLAGRGVNWDDGSLTAVIDAEGLGDSVRLIGQYDGMVDFMSALDVYCQSSLRNEGFPNVVGEAMACGAMCVATDVGDTRALIEDVGVLVPPGDVRALAEGIVSGLKTGPKTRRDLTLAGRRRIVDRYSMPQIARRYEELYAAHDSEGG